MMDIATGILLQQLSTDEFITSPIHHHIEIRKLSPHGNGKFISQSVSDSSVSENVSLKVSSLPVAMSILWQ